MRWIQTIQKYVERYRVESAVITGIIFGKIIADYLIFNSFSGFLFIAGAVFTFCNLAIFSFCNKYKNGFSQM